jgi:hypothetical protein
VSTHIAAVQRWGELYEREGVLAQKVNALERGINSITVVRLL